MGRLRAAEREAAGERWQEGDWLFATADGRGTSTRVDYDEWKELLRDANVRDGRLHDARHTAATVLLILGAPERAVMGLMGWSSTSMAARYQHMVDTVRTSVAEQLDGFLWEQPEGPLTTDGTSTRRSALGLCREQEPVRIALLTLPVFANDHWRMDGGIAALVAAGVGLLGAILGPRLAVSPQYVVPESVPRRQPARPRSRYEIKQRSVTNSGYASNDWRPYMVSTPHMTSTWRQSPR